MTHADRSLHYLHHKKAEQSRTIWEPNGKSPCSNEADKVEKELSKTIFKINLVYWPFSDYLRYIFVPLLYSIDSWRFHEISCEILKSLILTVSNAQSSIMKLCYCFCDCFFSWCEKMSKKCSKSNKNCAREHKMCFCGAFRY